MKIASWNVNGVRARLEHVTSWLETNQPDVLALCTQWTNRWIREV